MSFKFHQYALYEQTLGFCKDMYQLTGKLPDYEQAGLIHQLRLSSTQLVEEIATSLSRPKQADVELGLKQGIFIVCRIAAGIDVCHKLGYLDTATHKRALQLCEDITRNLHESKDK